METTENGGCKRRLYLNPDAATSDVIAAWQTLSEKGGIAYNKPSGKGKGFYCKPGKAAIAMLKNPNVCAGPKEHAHSYRDQRPNESEMRTQ